MANNASNLVNRECQPCSYSTPPLPPAKIQEYLDQISGWEISKDGKELIKNFKLKNFQEVLGFVNKIGRLSENDFILAAKIDKIVGGQE